MPKETKFIFKWSRLHFVLWSYFESVLLYKVATVLVIIYTLHNWIVCRLKHQLE